ncbi:MAG: hypothetical protein WCS89_02165 [Candidatus Paceibacterota bacterium]
MINKKLSRTKMKTMKFKKILIWSFINGQPHKLLTKEESKIANTMGVLHTLFPGINYYSTSGFHTAVSTCVQPVLEKLFPELIGTRNDSMTREDKVEISVFLPSKGYEWQDSKVWRRKFEKLLATK